MLALRAPHLWILCSTLGIVLTGCRRRLAVSSLATRASAGPGCARRKHAGPDRSGVHLRQQISRHQRHAGVRPRRVSRRRNRGERGSYPAAGADRRGPGPQRDRAGDRGKGDGRAVRERRARGPAAQRGGPLRRPGHLGRDGHGGRRGDGRLMDRAVLLADHSAPSEPAAQRARAVLGTHRHPPGLGPRHRRFHQRPELPRCCSARATPSCPMGACWSPADTSPTTTAPGHQPVLPGAPSWSQVVARCSAAGGIPPTPRSPPATS